MGNSMNNTRAADINPHCAFCSKFCWNNASKVSIASTNGSNVRIFCNDTCFDKYYARIDMFVTSFMKNADHEKEFESSDGEYNS